MSRMSRDQLAFSSGEVSPLLRARIDYQRYQTGLTSASGWLPLRQGGFTRAPGTIFRGYTRNNAKARLISFEFARNDALILEFTDGFMRVWRYGQLVRTGGGAIYELPVPYSEDQLEHLQWVQSSDVIYIAGGGLPIQRLARTALNAWTIADAPFSGGPFRVQNLDEGRTVQASGVIGSVTLTASAPVFLPGHAGSLMQFKASSYEDTPLWTGNTLISSGDRVRSDGKVYEMSSTSNGRTGDNPPIHDHGIEMTSMNPEIRWLYLHDGVGVVRITAVNSPTSATGQVVKRLPDDIMTSGTYRWSEGAWSNVCGYPTSVEIYDQRLVAAGSITEPRTVWFSTLGDYEDFEPGTEADSAFAYTIGGGSSQNKILWLKAGRRTLHIGALGEEYSGRSDGNEAINVTNAYFGFDGSIGSKPGARPIAPDGRPIFISKDGRRAMEIAYDFQSDANRSAELSLPSEHLGAVGLEELVWQSAPMRIAWFRRGDGSLAAMVYDPTEEVLGWSPVPVAGGSVEAMAVAADQNGTVDSLTVVVAREVDGQMVRMIEEQAQNFGVVFGDQPIHDAIHLFASSVFDVPAGQSVFSVPHLVGEEVSVWTDRGEFGPVVVAPGGAVETPFDVAHAVIGLFDPTQEAETLPLQPEVRDGSGRGRRKRLAPQTAITVHKTAAIQAAAVEHDPGQSARSWPLMNLLPRVVAAELSTAYSCTTRTTLTSGWAQDVTIRFSPVGGAPATVLAVSPILQEGGL